MKEVREVSSAPTSDYFVAPDGTPIVVDTLNKSAYAIDASNSVFPLGGGGLTNVNVSAGTTSNNLSAMTFGNGGGVSFGLNGSVITASAPAGGGGLTNINVSAGTTSNNLSALTFANSNGVSFGLSGSVITGTVATNYQSQGAYLTTAQPPGAYLTTARASNDAIGLNTAATQVTWTVNSSGISINAGAYLTTAMVSNAGSNFAGLGETTGTTSGTDLKLTVASDGVNISFPKWITTAAASDHSHGNPTLALTNLTGTTASASNGFTLSLSAAAAGGGGVGLNTAQTNVTWTVNSSGISVNAAGYAGTLTTFAGANISASMTFNSNGLNMSASVAAPGGVTYETVSYYANAQQFMNSQTMTFLQSTSHILPFVVDHRLSFDYIRVAVSGSVLAASSTAATTGNTSYTAGHFRSHNLVIYRRGNGAQSMSLLLVTGTQVTEAFRQTQSHAANSTQHSYTLNYTFPASNGSVGFTKNYSSSAASLNYHTSQLTDLTGAKIIEIPFAGSLSPGRYWLAYGVSSTTSTQRTADQSRQGIAYTFLGMSQGTVAFGYLGSSTNSSVMPFEGAGSFTTAGGGSTIELPMTRISSSASQNQLFFQLMRVT